MKKILGSAAAAALIIGFMPHVAAQTASQNATGDVGVEILEPLTIGQTQALGFGQVAAGAADGSVGCSTAGAVSSSNVTQVGGCTQGIFAVTGEADASISIQIPTGNVTLTSAAGDTLIVNGFTSDPGGAGGGTGSIPGGSTNINIGATLQVPAGSPPGAYAGTYTVTIDYN